VQIENVVVVVESGLGDVDNVGVVAHNSGVNIDGDDDGVIIVSLSDLVHLLGVLGSTGNQAFQLDDHGIVLLVDPVTGMHEGPSGGGLQNAGTDEGAQVAAAALVEHDVVVTSGVQVVTSILGNNIDLELNADGSAVSLDDFQNVQGNLVGVVAADLDDSVVIPASGIQQFLSLSGIQGYMVGIVVMAGVLVVGVGSQDAGVASNILADGDFVNQQGDSLTDIGVIDQQVDALAVGTLAEVEDQGADVVGVHGVDLDGGVAGLDLVGDNAGGGNGTGGDVGVTGDHGSDSSISGSSLEGQAGNILDAGGLAPVVLVTGQLSIVRILSVDELVGTGGDRSLPVGSVDDVGPCDALEAVLGQDEEVGHPLSNGINQLEGNLVALSGDAGDGVGLAVNNSFVTNNVLQRSSGLGGGIQNVAVCGPDQVLNSDGLAIRELQVVAQSDGDGQVVVSPLVSGSQAPYDVRQVLGINGLGRVGAVQGLPHKYGVVGQGVVDVGLAELVRAVGLVPLDDQRSLGFGLGCGGGVTASGLGVIACGLGVIATLCRLGLFVGLSFAASNKQTDDHDQSQQKCDEFLHCVFLLLIKSSACAEFIDIVQNSPSIIKCQPQDC